MSEKIIRAEVLAGILDDLGSTKPNAETCRMFLARAANSLRDLLEIVADPASAERCVACQLDAEGPDSHTYSHTCDAAAVRQRAAEIKASPVERLANDTPGCGPSSTVEEVTAELGDADLFGNLTGDELDVLLAKLRVASEVQSKAWPLACEAWMETYAVTSDAHKARMAISDRSRQRPSAWECSRCQRRLPGRKPEDGICKGCEAIGMTVVRADAPEASPEVGLVVFSLGGDRVEVAWGDEAMNAARAEPPLPFTSAVARLADLREVPFPRPLKLVSP